MKNSTLIFSLLLTLAASGCYSIYDEPKTATPTAPAPTPTFTPATAPVSAPVTTPTPAPAPIVTPDYSLAAKVVSVNTIGRFVVLSFPASQMPKMDQTLFIYRDGLKVAEVRVTGPQQDNNTVADITSGEAQVGDTVRDQ
jgi:zona occludens toxin (predicted ATPase)